MNLSLRAYYGPCVLFCCLILCLFIGCKPENKATKVILHSDLQGEWVIHKAFKAEKETRLLSNAYINFIPNQKLNTNILSTQEQVTYSLEKEQIIIADIENSVFNVDLVTSDTLVMRTKIRNIDFKFIFTKPDNS